jgi:hypothetical protein
MRQGGNLWKKASEKSSRRWERVLEEVPGRRQGESPEGLLDSTMLDSYYI